MTNYDDCVCTPDSRKVERLDPIFKGLTSIKLAQIFQSTIDEVEIRLVPGTNYSDADDDVLNDDVRKRIGALVGIRL